MPGKAGQRKLNIVTLGCSKNTVDSEKLSFLIKKGGFSVVSDPADTSADTVIINTCGFISDAREESIDTILGFVRAKESGNIRNLYVMGCMSEIYADELKREIPEVKKYFGVDNVNDILAELGLSAESAPRGERILTGPGHYAYLKVSEGCDRTCAFCSIPLIRGKSVSRPVEDIISEAEYLASTGVKEVILIAQDLSYYGLDLYKTRKLPSLVSGLVKLNAFHWIRLHYLYPSSFPPELYDLINDNPAICRYIDMPIQHVSDRMLKLMKRSHDGKQTRDLLREIRTRLPEAAIRTTLIAGHPGETEKEFDELKEFISEFRFDRLGVFPYSHEEGTHAWKNYRDDVPQKTKDARVAELMAIQQEISDELNSKKVGMTIKVLIDRKEGDFFVARTEHDSPDIDNEVLVSSEKDLNPGEFHDILITGSTEFDLFGVPVTNGHGI